MNVAEEVSTRARRYGGSNRQQRKYLLSRLEKLHANEVVPALLSIFARTADPESETAYGEQELAGHLLLFGRHSCPVPLRDALLILLEGWNVSIEELPWYLAREFGREAVRSCIAGLLESHISEHQQDILRTLDFWVCRYEPKAHPL